MPTLTESQKRQIEADVLGGGPVQPTPTPSAWAGVNAGPTPDPRPGIPDMRQAPPQPPPGVPNAVQYLQQENMKRYGAPKPSPWQGVPAPAAPSPTAIPQDAPEVIEERRRVRDSFRGVR